MSAYISIENQTLLWNTMQKIQLLHEKIPQYQQQEWFKQIVGIFYKKIQYTSYDLRKLNKETIGYMIHILKTEEQETTPKFNEPINDGVIENMEELLQQQRKQRELDVVPFQQTDIMELRREIKQLKEEVEQLKKLITEPKEVSE
jgi:hypothetical protein